MVTEAQEQDIEKTIGWLEWFWSTASDVITGQTISVDIDDYLTDDAPMAGRLMSRISESASRNELSEDQQIRYQAILAIAHEKGPLLDSLVTNGPRHNS